jgi:hypothetical protein
MVRVKLKALGEKPVPLPIHPSWISHAFTQYWTQSYKVKLKGFFFSVFCNCLTVTDSVITSSNIQYRNMIILIPSLKHFFRSFPVHNSNNTKFLVSFMMRFMLSSYVQMKFAYILSNNYLKLNIYILRSVLCLQLKYKWQWMKFTC